MALTPGQKPGSTSLPPSGGEKPKDPSKTEAPERKEGPAPGTRADTNQPPLEGGGGQVEPREGPAPNPDAPYAPPGAPTGVDVNIARDGSGTQQTEPFADEYPPDARIEPTMQQVNPRTATSILEPYVPAPYEPEPPVDDPPLALDAAMLAEADEPRKQLIRDTREAFRDRPRKAGQMPLRQTPAGHDRRPADADDEGEKTEPRTNR